MSDNLVYLFAAFAVTWIVLFLYVFFIARRQQEVEEELRSLRQQLQPRQPGSRQPESEKDEGVPDLKPDSK